MPPRSQSSSSRAPPKVRRQTAAPSGEHRLGVAAAVGHLLGNRTTSGGAAVARGVGAHAQPPGPRVRIAPPARFLVSMGSPPASSRRVARRRRGAKSGRRRCARGRSWREPMATRTRESAARRFVAPRRRAADATQKVTAAEPILTRSGEAEAVVEAVGLAERRHGVTALCRLLRVEGVDVVLDVGVVVDHLVGEASARSWHSRR